MARTTTKRGTRSTTKSKIGKRIGATASSKRATTMRGKSRARG